MTLVDKVDPQEEQRKLALRLAEQQAAARKRKAILALCAGVAVVLAVWFRRRR